MVIGVSANMYMIFHIVDIAVVLLMERATMLSGVV
jgi:hypothetical protein